MTASSMSSVSVIPDSEPLRHTGASEDTTVDAMNRSPSPAPASVHVAPKRTYVRNRPSVATMDTAPVPIVPVSPERPSRAEELEIVASSTSDRPVSPSPGISLPIASDWKRKLALMDAEADHDEDDDEEVERYMKKQREALETAKDAALVTSSIAKLGSVAAIAARTDVKSSSSLPPLTASSSSLPPLTSSPSTRLTSPPAPAVAASPIRSPVKSRIVELQSSPDAASADEESCAVHRPSYRSTSNRKKRAPLFRASDDEEDDTLPTERPSSERDTSEERTPRPTTRRRKKQRFSSPDAEDEALGDLDVPEPASPLPTGRRSSPSSSKRSGTVSPRMTVTSSKRSALQGLARSKAARRQHDEEDVAQATELEAEIQAVVSDLGGVGSDEEFDVRMSGKGKRAKERPIKGLTKKDKLETERMQREIRQQKRVNMEMFFTEARTMPDVLREVLPKVSQSSLSSFQPPIQAPPTLVPDTNPASSSSMEATPQDDILAFSSVARRNEAENDDDMGPHTQSSPSAARSGMPSNSYGLVLKPADHAPKRSQKKLVTDHDSDDDAARLPGVDDLMRETKNERLKKRKLAELTRHDSDKQRPAQTEEEEDDDLEFDRPPAKAPVKLGGSASAVLHHKQPKISEAQRKLMAFVGAGAVKREASESMLQYAGHRFAHAAAPLKDGRYKPTGLKSNKTTAITSQQMAADLLAKSKKQAAEETRRKEKESGLRARPLPERVNLDAETLLAATNASHVEDLVSGADSDDDDEDADFRPDDAASVRENGGAEGFDDERIAYSGESEGELHEAGEEGGEGESDKENVRPSAEPPVRDKENVDPAAEEETAMLMIASKRIKHKMIVVDSDDEMDGVQPPRTAEVAVAAATSEVEPELELDGGFSQFFEATQAGGPEMSQAGFGVLRHAAAPEIRADDSVFPSVKVSATAQRRDEALLQAELAVSGPASGSTADARQPGQYINEQGFFTQTKPKSILAAQESVISTVDDESLAPLQPTLDDEPALSATYRTRAGSPPREASASPVGRKLKRLRYRSMAVHEEAEEAAEEEAEEAAEQEQEPDAGSTLLEDTQVTENDTLSLPSLIPAAPAHKPINAFDTLMASKGQPSVPDRRAGAGGRPTIDAQGFLEDQADESEEEDAFGIGGHSDDEPEDGEEGDGVIEGLVDDQEMTEAEKEADRRAVQEKHREIIQQDDKANEDLHRDAIAGKLRGRRRDGVMGLDLSDDDDDQEDDRSRRRRLAKRKDRMVEGGVDELKDMDANAPFRQVYENELVDSSDEDDVAPLNGAEGDYDSHPRSPRRRSSSPLEIRHETISAAEVQARVREMARENSRKDEEARARREVVPKMTGKTPMIDLDDSEDDSEDEAGFRVTRNARVALKPTKQSTTKDKRYQQLLDNESQNPSDSRRAGGNSSVSQLKRGDGGGGGGGGDSRGSSTTYRGQQRTRVGSRAPPLPPQPKKQSSMSAVVMSKGRGFQS